MVSMILIISGVSGKTLMKEAVTHDPGSCPQILTNHWAVSHREIFQIKLFLIISASTSWEHVQVSSVQWWRDLICAAEDQILTENLMTRGPMSHISWTNNFSSSLTWSWCADMENWYIREHLINDDSYNHRDHASGVLKNLATLWLTQHLDSDLQALSHSIIVSSENFIFSFPAAMIHDKFMMKIVLWWDQQVCGVVSDRVMYGCWCSGEDTLMNLMPGSSLQCLRYNYSVFRFRHWVLVLIMTPVLIWTAAHCCSGSWSWDWRGSNHWERGELQEETAV